MTKEICANCKWWHPEVDALPNDLRDVAFNLTQGEATPLMSEYGKCRAEYVNPNGEPIVYDAGSLGATKCFAKDDRGNLLFSPAPED